MMENFRAWVSNIQTKFFNWNFKFTGFALCHKKKSRRGAFDPSFFTFFYNLCQTFSVLFQFVVSIKSREHLFWVWKVVKMLKVPEFYVFFVEKYQALNFSTPSSEKFLSINCGRCEKMMNCWWNISKLSFHCKNMHKKLNYIFLWSALDSFITSRVFPIVFS